MSQGFFEGNINSMKSFVELSQSDAPNILGSGRNGFDIRRWGEALISIPLLVLAFPMLLLVGVAVKVSSRGPIIYTQKRIGKDGKVFLIYKFRTMFENAEAKSGPILSKQTDNRLTIIGRFLRNSHLDETPQILNIIKGEMSYIGPRPERDVFVARFNHEVPFYQIRENIRPGVTGLAQVCCGYEASPNQKLEFDLAYIKHHASLKMNLMVLLLTAKKLLLVRFNL